MTENLKFIHIPKTAGTSIEDWGLVYGFKWGRFDRKIPLNPGIQTGKWHSTADWWDPHFSYFCVVREPTERFVSSLNFLGIKIGPDQIDKYIQENLKKSSFVRNPYVQSFVPQYEYVYKSDGSRFVEHVLNYSKLQSEFTELMIKCKCYYAYRDLPRNNVTKNKRYSIKQLSDTTLDALRDFYAKDYSLYYDLD